MSGVFAARSIIKGEDYEKALKPLKDHIENISVFRNHIENFSNKDFDKLVSIVGTPGIKQLIYNTGIGFPDIVGKLLKKLMPE